MVYGACDRDAKEEVVVAVADSDGDGETSEVGICLFWH